MTVKVKYKPSIPCFTLSAEDQFIVVPLAPISSLIPFTSICIFTSLLPAITIEAPLLFSTKSFLRKYNPIGEYGGWGLRLGLFGRGKAFNVSGDKGLQLEFLDKRKLLIGTNKPDKLIETLNKLGHIKQ